MEGLLPPNVSLHDSDLLGDGIDTEVQLHVGCSDEVDEIVVWIDINKEGTRRLEHIFTTDSPSEAAACFNLKLAALGEQGFDIEEEVEVDAIQLQRAMPDKLEPDKAKPDSNEGGSDEPPPGSSGLLYG